MKNCVLLFASLVLVLFWGCSDDVVSDNHAPFITDAKTEIVLKKGDNLTITPELVKATDEDGDSVSIILFSGSNYTLSGATIIPDEGYIGELYVRVRVTDGELESGLITITIIIVDVVQLLPLISGSWWNYRDSIIGDTSMLSKLEVIKEDTLDLNGSKTPVATLSWSHLSEDTAYFLMGNDSSGVTSYGGVSPYHRLDTAQLFLPYPVTMTDNWNYSPIKYNASDKQFFLDTEVAMTCLDTSLYVTVPAGTFDCYVYSFKYTQRGGRKTDQSIGFTGIKNRCNRAHTVEERLFYSVGVGYVKNETRVNNTVTWVKELTDYRIAQDSGAM